MSDPAPDADLTYIDRVRPAASMVPRSRADKRRLLIAVLLAPMPGFARRRLGKWLLGWELADDAHIGFSIVDARKVVLGPGAIIRSFTVVKGLEELRMGREASIGARNWISGPPLSAGMFDRVPNRFPALVMEERAAIAYHHTLDCSDTITMGRFALLAGTQTLVYTHSVDLVRFAQDARPTTISEFSVILTRCTLLAGTTVAARSIVSAGSVVNTHLTEEQAMYSGVPATKIRDLPDTLALWKDDRPRFAF